MRPMSYPWFTRMALLFITLQYLDYMTTSVALRLPAIGEQNPLMAPIISSPLLALGAKAAVTLWVIWQLDRMRRPHLVWPVWVLVNATMLGVVLNNVRVILA